MSGLKNFYLAFMLLVLWGGTLAAASAPSVTPLMMNGPLLGSAVTQPGEEKWFSFSFPPGLTCVTIEVIPGTLPNHEFSCQTVATGWAPYYRASSQGALYSTKITCYLQGSSLRYIAVRALDGKSTGSFSIHVTSGPALSSFSINNGTASTPYSNVNLNFYVSSVALASCTCLCSESPDFRGAAWRPYANPFKFALSSGFGLKTVYLKLRNAGGVESAVYAATIYLNQIQTLRLNAPALSGTVSVRGEEVCFPFTITTQGRYRIETTTLSNGPASARIYLCGSRIDDAPVSGQPSLRAINADLPPGSYLARVTASSLPCAFTIRLSYGGSLTSFAINNNASETASRLVTLTSAAAGQPAYYKASLYSNFADSLWLPYAAAVPFKLNGGSGLKAVYFKVKDASGSESETKIGKITLNDLLTLEVDDDWVTGNLERAGGIDAWLLTVKTAGNYTIETRCGTLKDTLLFLYRQDDPKTVLAQDDDSGRNYAARIDTPLAPGTYLVKVTTPFVDLGSYSIKVKKN